MSAARYKVLDTRAASVPSRQAAPAGPAAPSAKADATARITNVDVSAEPVVVTAQIDPFDPATSNPLAELHAVFVPAGTAQPADVSTLVAPGGSLPTQGFDVSTQAAGAEVKFSLANINPGAEPVAGAILLIGGYKE